MVVLPSAVHAVMLPMLSSVHVVTLSIHAACCPCCHAVHAVMLPMLSPVHVAVSLILPVLPMLTPVSRLGMWNLPLEQRLGNFGDVTSRIELRNAAGQLTAYVAKITAIATFSIKFLYFYCTE
jgi:hypothetical protein